jgi:transposase
MEGLKDRPKGGRHPKISRQTEYRIKTILKESNQQGWTTKQVEKMIIKEGGIKYHHNYIYCILCRWGFIQKVLRKVHVNTASAEEKEDFKKRSARYLWVKIPKERL